MRQCARHGKVWREIVAEIVAEIAARHGEMRPSRMAAQIVAEIVGLPPRFNLPGWSQESMLGRLLEPIHLGRDCKLFWRSHLEPIHLG